MKAKTILAIAIATAAAIAACSSPTDTLSNGEGGDPSGGDGSGAGGGTGGRKKAQAGTAEGGAAGTTAGGAGTGIPEDGSPTPTSNPAGKAFYIASVHPLLSSTCGGCHDAAGPGTNWITNANADRSYGQIFQLGYVSRTSRLLVKGPHGGVTTNVLSASAQATFTQWVDMEIASGGVQATPNVLEKVAKCMDQTKFNAIGLQNLRTIQRTDGNNVNRVQGWAENANRCTGCNNAPCRDCHSADAGSNFAMALGNQALPADYTFQQTKLNNPAYIQKYFGVSATGNPVESTAIDLKSAATAKDKAYTHPYFTLTAAQKTAIKAFVDDAAAKYAAGTCAP